MNTTECIKILSEYAHHRRSRSVRSVPSNEDVNEAIDYAVERLKAMQWRPISEAPRLEKFLGFMPNYYVNMLGKRVNLITVCERDIGAHYGFDSEHGHIDPTYFMPLPIPPESEGV